MKGPAQPGHQEFWGSGARPYFGNLIITEVFCYLLRLQSGSWLKCVHLTLDRFQSSRAHGPPGPTAVCEPASIQPSSSGSSVWGLVEAILLSICMIFFVALWCSLRLVLYFAFLNKRTTFEYFSFLNFSFIFIGYIKYNREQIA